MKVTPWEVEGKIDYDRLIKEFGTKPITSKILKRIEKHTGELHYLLRRGIFFCHRDLDWLLDKYENGESFYLYTGRGPSGYTHLGHLIPWILTKWLQDKFDAELWFQLTDDEKFLFNQKLDIEDAKKYAYENALDIIALGFKRGKTFIFTDTDYSGELYPQAIKVAKKITFSTAKAVFGFKNESNIGQIFFTSMQSVPAFLPSVKKGKNIPCLIPLAIDQDPHFRVARDVLPKLGFYKPAIIHSKFMPSLSEGGKMSASDPQSCIFTTDTPGEVERKIWNAFTGGRGSLKEQKEKGGNPDICPIYQYYYFLFEQDDKKLKEIYNSCRSGNRTCGECKRELIDRINSFLKKHQERREKAKKVLDKFILKS
ncbi:MAG: tryptophan--tRNA ligase [Candidatus Aenigmarchaeota archaeon]|nr:tryptophan--tRNA ligase [Candidatus Aenigmarchaeota archaeon]